MATRKSKTPSDAKSRPAPAPASPTESIGTVLSTFSGPSTSRLDDVAAASLPTVPEQRLATQKVGAQLAAAAMPANPLKPAEIGAQAGQAPQVGPSREPHDAIDTASTVTEDAVSAKVGEGVPKQGYSPVAEPLDRARVDSSGQWLTTNMGTAVADNQNSLKAGLRGIARSDITHISMCVDSGISDTKSQNVSCADAACGIA